MALRTVALADLHTDSEVGLANLEEKEYRAQSDLFAPVREALFETWRTCTKSQRWGEPEVLLVDGDLIEGQNKKHTGSGVICTNLRRQCAHAAALLNMWRARKVFVFRGSGYHVEVNGSGWQAEEYAASLVQRAQIFPNQAHVPAAEKERSGWHCYLTLAGLTFHVAHKVGVSKVFHYQSTPVARAMLQARLNDMLRHEINTWKTRVILRAHAHYYNHVEYSGSDGWVLPCWKGLDEHMMEGGSLDISPDIGFVGFEIHAGKLVYEKNLFKLADVQPPPHVVIGEGRRRR
jgi:hypothetical protein